MTMRCCFCIKHVLKLSLSASCTAQKH